MEIFQHPDELLENLINEGWLNYLLNETANCDISTTGQAVEK